MNQIQFQIKKLLQKKLFYQGHRSQYYLESSNPTVPEGIGYISSICKKITSFTKIL